ncbi:hypothetical protein CFC21_071532, partial [Triticum aestivum]
MAASRALAALLAVVVFMVCSPAPRVLATDPTQLQDFCVADIMNPVIVNGFVCKNMKMVTANDFFLPGLNKPGMLNAQGSAGDTGDGAAAAGAEHAGHLNGAHRLRAQRRAEPAAHTPPRHRDPHRDHGAAAGGVRHLQPAGREEPALHQATSGGRRIRVPTGARPLPGEQRQGARRGHRGAQQPGRRRDHHRQRRLRVHAAHQRPHPRQGLHDREGHRRLDPGQVRAGHERQQQHGRRRLRHAARRRRGRRRQQHRRRWRVLPWHAQAEAL